MAALYPNYCYACDSRHEIRVVTVQGQEIYLCLDCWLDYERQHLNTDQVVIVSFFRVHPPDEPETP